MWLRDQHGFHAIEDPCEPHSLLKANPVLGKNFVMGSNVLYKQYVVVEPYFVVKTHYIVGAPGQDLYSSISIFYPLFISFTLQSSANQLLRCANLSGTSILWGHPHISIFWGSLTITLNKYVLQNPGMRGPLGPGLLGLGQRMALVCLELLCIIYRLVKRVKLLS